MIKSCLVAAALVAAASFQFGICIAADSNNEAVHGNVWAFGQSELRNEAIWKNGVDGNSMLKKSAPQKQSGATNTTGGIDRALKKAEENNIRGSVGMSMANEESTWKVAPDQKRAQPDESMYRDRRHVVRAFAGVNAGDDLNISVGPELILKDDQHGEESANESQPDSALGLGMRFKYDF